MKTILKILTGFITLILLVVWISAVSNIGLPTESDSVETLGELEKARAAEMFHLRGELGDAVWKGWGQADIPVILHNEAYAFLLGYPGEPPAGWVMMPSGEQRGGPWEVVPDDTFQGEPYYRQPLTDLNATPENFTVMVGDRWAATLFTKEYAGIAFYQGMREELPALIRPVVPYRLIWQGLMGRTETYIEGMAHESFHSFQGMTVPDRLADAERVAPLEDEYPWDGEAVRQAWTTELDLLYQAVTAESDGRAAELARQFLNQRETRRQLPEFTSRIADYERKREWLEGLAKYSELALGLEAARTSDYQPVASIAEDAAFKNYDTQERFWSQQLSEVRRRGDQEGESRFYYSGMAQAFLLDRLDPGWKDRIWEADVWLEELLTGAVLDGVDG